MSVIDRAPDFWERRSSQEELAKWTGRVYLMGDDFPTQPPEISTGQEEPATGDLSAQKPTEITPLQSYLTVFLSK